MSIEQQLAAMLDLSVKQEKLGTAILDSLMAINRNLETLAAPLEHRAIETPPNHEVFESFAVEPASEEPPPKPRKKRVSKKAAAKKATPDVEEAPAEPTAAVPAQNPPGAVNEQPQPPVQNPGVDLFAGVAQTPATEPLTDMLLNKELQVIAGHVDGGVNALIPLLAKRSLSGLKGATQEDLVGIRSEARALLDPIVRMQLFGE